MVCLVSSLGHNPCHDSMSLMQRTPCPSYSDKPHYNTQEHFHVLPYHRLLVLCPQHTPHKLMDIKNLFRWNKNQMNNLQYIVDKESYGKIKK